MPSVGEVVLAAKHAAPTRQAGRKNSQLQFMIPADAQPQLSFVLGRMDAALGMDGTTARAQTPSAAFAIAVEEFNAEFDAEKASKRRRGQAPDWALVSLARGSPTLRLCMDVEGHVRELLHGLRDLSLWRKEVCEQRLLPLHHFTHLTVVCAQLARAKGQMHGLLSLLLSQVRALFVESSHEPSLLLHRELLMWRDNQTTAQQEIERTHTSKDHLQEDLTTCRAGERWTRLLLNLAILSVERASQGFHRDMKVYLVKVKERTNVQNILRMEADELGIEGGTPSDAGKKSTKFSLVVKKQQALLKHAAKKTESFEEQVKKREAKLLEQQEAYRDAIKEYETEVEALQKKRSVADAKAAQVEEDSQKLASDYLRIESVLKDARREISDLQRAVTERFAVLGPLETKVTEAAKVVETMSRQQLLQLTKHEALEVASQAEHAMLFAYEAAAFIKNSMVLPGKTDWKAKLEGRGVDDTMSAASSPVHTMPDISPEPASGLAIPDRDESLNRQERILDADNHVTADRIDVDCQPVAENAGDVEEVPSPVSSYLSSSRPPPSGGSIEFGILPADARTTPHLTTDDLQNSQRVAEDAEKMEKEKAILEEEKAILENEKAVLASQNDLLAKETASVIARAQDLQAAEAAFASQRDAFDQREAQVQELEKQLQAALMKATAEQHAFEESSSARLRVLEEKESQVESKLEELRAFRGDESKVEAILELKKTIADKDKLLGIERERIANLEKELEVSASRVRETVNVLVEKATEEIMKEMSRKEDKIEKREELLAAKSSRLEAEIAKIHDLSRSEKTMRDAEQKLKRANELLAENVKREVELSNMAQHIEEMRIQAQVARDKAAISGDVDQMATAFEEKIRKLNQQIKSLTASEKQLMAKVQKLESSSRRATSTETKIVQNQSEKIDEQRPAADKGWGVREPSGAHYSSNEELRDLAARMREQEQDLAEKMSQMTEKQTHLQMTYDAKIAEMKQRQEELDAQQAKLAKESSEISVLTQRFKGLQEMTDEQVAVLRQQRQAEIDGIVAQYDKAKAEQRLKQTNLERQVREGEEELLRRAQLLGSKAQVLGYIQEAQEASLDHAGYRQHSEHLKALATSPSLNVSHLFALHGMYEDRLSEISAQIEDRKFMLETVDEREHSATRDFLKTVESAEHTYLAHAGVVGANVDPLMAARKTPEKVAALPAIFPSRRGNPAKTSMGGGFMVHRPFARTAPVLRPSKPVTTALRTHAEVADYIHRASEPLKTIPEPMPMGGNV